MDITIITQIELDEHTMTVHTVLPPPSAGVSKQEILERFVDELRPHAPDMLGRVVRLNGRATTEMALALGIVAARFGAVGVQLYSPADGEYVPVAGAEEVAAPLSMPMLVLPGMEVEVTRDGGLFRRGARAVVLNVGRDSVNIAEKRGHWHGRRRRDTGWTAIENVRPVAWEQTPEV